MTATDLSSRLNGSSVADALLREMDRIRQLLTGDLTGGSPRVGPSSTEDVSPVDRLVEGLGLTDFETDVVLLAAAAELDGQVASVIADMTGGSDPRPTFSLALSVFPDGHWDAIAPDGPLRYWRLISLDPGPVLAAQRLQLDERILHFLTDIRSLDPRLSPLLVHLSPTDAELVPSHEAIAEDLLDVLAGLRQPATITLSGDDSAAQVRLAQRVIERLECQPLTLASGALPPAGPDLAELLRRIDREAVLSGALPVFAQSDDRRHAVPFITASSSTPLLFFIGDAGATGHRADHRVRLPRRVDHPTSAEQQQLWSATLRPDVAARCADTIGEISHEHRLDSATIRSIALEINADVPDAEPGEHLRRLCRERTRLDAGMLAQRIEPLATWNDIVLPDAHMTLLRDIAAHVRHRRAVYDEWQFSRKTSRGLGITALFAGESGTGKTMAAEVLANDLGLDLYRIDLAATVSKYIGETEKNLSRLFDAAEASGAILLFDEADALFGKRGDVKDSHDRYANMEVAYLLQRMESYRGLAILTTNLRDNIDQAFVRRIRFIVRFPFPDPDHRARIWAGVFPEATPVEGLEPHRLAQMAIPGGSIWNIALAAAFRAADDGGIVTPDHVLRAARIEYAKSDRVLTESEMAGWA